MNYKIIAKYLKEHPNSHHGSDISAIAKYVRPILVNTPTIAASAVIYKSIKQHEVESNGILIPDRYIHYRFTEGKWIDTVNWAYEEKAPKWDQRKEVAYFGGQMTSM